MSRAHSYSHSRAHSPNFPSLHLRHNTFSNPSVVLPTSQLILEPFRCFTYVTVHSPILLLLLLHHKLCSFSNLSITSPTSQHILQLFRRFTYITAHSPTFPSLHLRHNSFSNLSSFHRRHNSFSKTSVALPTSQLILQPFRCFTYVTVNSPTLLSILLCHKLCSFSKLSVTSPTSQLILQPFLRFTYITDHSPTPP